MNNTITIYDGFFSQFEQFLVGAMEQFGYSGWKLKIEEEIDGSHSGTPYAAYRFTFTSADNFLSTSDTTAFELGDKEVAMSIFEGVVKNLIAGALTAEGNRNNTFKSNMATFELPNQPQIISLFDEKE